MRGALNARFWLVGMIGLMSLTVAGSTSAASLERLVMPGLLVEGHAELEDDCGSCHANFDATRQDALCLDCHEEVAADLTDASGFHGRVAESRACKQCHTEHQGRTADIVGLNPGLFDHGDTDFPLDGAHGRVSCGGCHLEDEPHRAAADSCVACHETDEPHEGNLGDDCGGCHDNESWQVAAFDHDDTSFPLLGKHISADKTARVHAGPTCGSCHLDDTFAAPDRCVSCHSKDDVHAGRRGEDCADCHSESGWTGASFDHLAVTGHPLEGAHADLVCASCHLSAMEIPEPPTGCNGCHSANDPHQGRNGADCSQCHDQHRWQDARFDHAGETGFKLIGAHGTLACEGCHRGKLTDPLQTQCADCHADDDPHAGSYPSCEGCHSPKGWWDVAFNHDFADFPLIGHHKLVACESCHVEETFQGATQLCLDCHLDSDRHDGVFTPHCQRCHNPNGWSRWRFDHDADTAFALDGRHTNLECDACHKSNVWTTQALASCASCHVADDLHEGRFGDDCAECHTTDGFDDIREFSR